MDVSNDQSDDHGVLTSRLIHFSQCSAPLGKLVRGGQRYGNHILSCDKILKIICSWNTLGLGSSQKVLHDWVSVVSERNFDWTLKTMNVPVFPVSKLSR